MCLYEPDGSTQIPPMRRPEKYIRQRILTVATVLARNIYSGST